MKKLIGIILLILIAVVVYADPPSPLVNGLTNAANVTITGGNVTGLTSLSATTANVDHIGEKTGSHGVVLDNKTVGLSSIDWAKGADIASATSIDLGAATGNYVEITGTTTIAALGTATAGVTRYVRFIGALTLTYNATSLILPGARDILTAANDRAVFVSLGSGNWLCHEYLKANGRVLGDVVIATVGSTRAITTDEVRGNKLNFTGAYTGTLPTAVVNMSFEAISSTAAVYSLDVQAGDHWDVAGASLTNGNKITSDGTKQAWLKATCYTANVWTLESSNYTPIDGGS